MRKVVRQRLLAKYKNKCARCGATERLEVDHIVPLSRGGRHDEDNMQILCKRCNLKKGCGVDFSPFFRIGKSPEYIEINQGFSQMLAGLKPNEMVGILLQKLRENDQFFGTEPEAGV